MSTALITHPACLLHDNGPYHPECPDRLRAVLASLEAEEFAGLLREQAPLATVEQLPRVHPQDYVEAILAIRPEPGEHRAARRRHRHGQRQRRSRPACRGRRGRGRRCRDGRLGARTAFAAVRPPGHHAEPDTPDGLLPVQQRRDGARACPGAIGPGAGRDRRFRRPSRQGHAGHGRARPRSLLRLDASVPAAIPAPARARETGIGQQRRQRAAARPAPAALNSAHAWGDRILPALDGFAPELVIVSAGFDAHAADPLAQLKSRPRISSG